MTSKSVISVVKHPKPFHFFFRNVAWTAKTPWVLMMQLQSASMVTTSPVVSMETCLLPIMRTSQQERQEVLLCRGGFPCLSLTQLQRWTWHQRPLIPLLSLIPHLSQVHTYQRPTMSHAKRSMPKKLGRAKNPPRRSLSNQCLSDHLLNTPRIVI